MTNKLEQTTKKLITGIEKLSYLSSTTEEPNETLTSSLETFSNYTNFLEPFINKSLYEGMNNSLNNIGKKLEKDKPLTLTLTKN